MSRFLPSDFHGEKYGLSFRLVNESDAETIIRFRTLPQVGSFLHKTSKNIDDQINWIKAYKKREKAGLEYYFIFSKNNNPIGLNRIYDIHDDTFTAGSWVMAPDSPIEVILAVPLIIREIAFEILDMKLEDSHDGVHVDNKKVLKFNKWFGCIDYKHYQSEQGEFIALKLTKEDFENNKPRLIQMLNLDKNE